MIIVTGGAGFIGSALVFELNRRGITDIIIVDHLGETDKWKNLLGLRFADYLEKDVFIEKITSREFAVSIQTVFHLGACSDTLEKDARYLLYNNYEYTRELARYCLEKNIRFIYASSAATYGDGAHGYDDDEALLEQLRPLNMYGYSKHLFDLWAKQNQVLNRMVGLKYFNVFGPNEYHKGEMRSKVHKAYQEINDCGSIKLFKSRRKDYRDGEQQRDFLYVKDAVAMTLFFLDHPDVNGIYNIGSGVARTWLDLARAVFAALDRKPSITFIDMPDDLAGRYQYFTRAEIGKLTRAGWATGTAGMAPGPAGFEGTLYDLESAVRDYVVNYLAGTGPCPAGEKYLDTGTALA